MIDNKHHYDIRGGEGRGEERRGEGREDEGVMHLPLEMLIAFNCTHESYSAE